ncbi:MAG TPA: rhodanese-like domain-containing protein [Dissulfurispiraceae bacterium]|nr:rhodanese-like domain-containing protein [Dissulfurispiraceae bacterium]
MDRKRLISLLFVAAACVLTLVPCAIAQEQVVKQQILAPCKQCHAPDAKLLRGTLGNLSQKAEIFSINAGAVWNVKFDDSTKLVGWNAPIGKIPKDKEIAVVFVQKGSDVFAQSISVKPPARIPPEKLVNVDQVAEHIEKGDAVIIDSRPSARFIEGSIPGAINIYDAEFDKNIDKLPADKGKLLIFYCAGVT